MDREVCSDVFSKALPPIQLVERIACWKHRAFDDFKNEVYPAVFEMETSPFRHGPPGCEDVIRSMFERMGSKLLELMSASMSVETDPLKLEADLYILGQFVESIMVDFDHENEVLFEDLFFLQIRYLLSFFPSILSTALQHVLHFQNDLLSRQYSFLLFRLLFLKSDLPEGIPDISMESTLHLLQRDITSPYGADLLMALTSYFPKVVQKANVNESIISSFQVRCNMSGEKQNTSLYTVVRMKLAKCLVLIYRDASLNNQIQLFVRLWEFVCAQNTDVDTMLCAAVILNSVWQLFDNCR